MKKLLAVLLCASMTIMTFTGCEAEEVREKAQSFADSVSEAVGEWNIDEIGESIEQFFDDAVTSVQENDSETKKAALKACKNLTVWSGTTAESFGGGSGTYENPYQISNGEQLAKLASDVNSGIDFEGVYFELTSDILLNDVSEWNFSDLEANSETVYGWNSFSPIGLNYYFKGNFDGNGYTIYGLCNTHLYFVSYGFLYIGLFGRVQSGSISNLDVACAYLSTSSTGSYIDAGFIAGFVYSDTSIVDCHVRQAVYANNGNSGTIEVGGICGYNGSEEILGCSVENTLIQCVDSATSYRLYAGGICGYLNGGEASSCYSDCDIVITKELYDDDSSPYVYIGGICGCGSATGCYSTGDINITLTENSEHTESDDELGAQVRIGGISGWIWDGISNCGCTGAISYSGDVEDVNIGGIAGLMRDASITCSYSNMSIETGGSGYAVVGGIVGNSYYRNSSESNQIISCFYNSDYATRGIGQSTNYTFSNNVYGFTLKELKDTSNYYDWDFDRTWTAKNSINGGLPVPKSLVEYF